jgi:tetratricopeptide (TPR) repeat protein
MQDDPQIIEKVLSLLRQYGWEIGYKKLEAELQAADDKNGRGVGELFLGWMAAERGEYKEAVARFDALSQIPRLAAWAILGQAFVAQRQKDFGLFRRLLNQANEQAGDDKFLHATIAHLRATSLYHEGKPDEAYPLLLEALDGFGDDHFGTGRVLDTLGMIYAGKNNFHAAQEFFIKALQCKERHQDKAGLAVTHGQLGRLYLDWEFWEKADRHFKKDLEISKQIRDKRGEAQMYNYLAQVSMARGEEEALKGAAAAAQKHWKDAAALLDTK